MQNFSISRSLVGPVPVISRAEDTLLWYGIPETRRNKIHIRWLNWGLTTRVLETMTPGVLRVSYQKVSTGDIDYGIPTR